VRNIALFGNPVFPFYDDVFSKIPPAGKLAELKPELIIDQDEMLDIFEYKGGIERIARFIPDLSFSVKFVRNPIGPVHIAILPFLLLLGIAGIGKHIAKYIFKWQTEIHYDIPVFMCVVIVVAYASYWIFSANLIHSRYFSPAIPFLSILGGYTLYHIFQIRRVKGTHVFAQTVIVAFGMLAIFYFNSAIIDLKISELPLSDKTRTKFVSEKISSWDAVMHMNNTMKLSRDYKVYGLGCEDARYYANFTLIGGPWGYADWRSFADAAKTGKELHKFLSDYGCTYLLYDTTSIPYLKKYYATIKLPKDSSFDKYFTKVTHMDFTTIYKLNNVAPGVE
jgi:hypothetical protein